MLIRAEAVVLRSKNLGEADKIVTLYSREFGKIRAAANGCRRSRNRLLGPTQVFSHGRYLVFKGKGLGNISQGELLQSFQPLREDLEKMAYASYVAELLDAMVDEGEPSPDVFSLLLNTLDRIRCGQYHLSIRAFEIRLVSLLGYQPELESCIECGCTVGGAGYFSREGGVLCSKCKQSASRRISPSVRQWLERLLEWDFQRLSVLHPSENDLRSLGSLLREYLDFRLERPLKSLEFLNTLQALDLPPNGSEVKTYEC